MPDKVTAGKWVVGLGNDTVKAIDGEDYDFIADCDCGKLNDGYLPSGQVKANARLMAASKKMYRMLRDLYVRDGVSMPTWRELGIKELLESIDVEVD
jgi:hypothetical protein